MGRSVYETARPGRKHTIMSQEDREKGKPTVWDEIEIKGSVKNLSLSLFNYTHLRVLYMNDNQLQRIPTEIAKLQKLQVLDLSNNRLRGLPAELGDMPELRVLRMDSNQLRQLPYELGKLFQLEELGLANNPLTPELQQVYEAGVPGFLQYMLDRLRYFHEHPDEFEQNELEQATDENNEDDHEWEEGQVVSDWSYKESNGYQDEIEHHNMIPLLHTESYYYSQDYLMSHLPPSVHMEQPFEDIREPWETIALHNSGASAAAEMGAAYQPWTGVLTQAEQWHHASQYYKQSAAMPNPEHLYGHHLATSQQDLPYTLGYQQQAGLAFVPPIFQPSLQHSSYLPSSTLPLDPGQQLSLHSALPQHHFSTNPAAWPGVSSQPIQGFRNHTALQSQPVVRLNDQSFAAGQQAQCQGGQMLESKDSEARLQPPHRRPNYMYRNVSYHRGSVPNSSTSDTSQSQNKGSNYWEGYNPSQWSHDQQ